MDLPPRALRALPLLAGAAVTGLYVRAALVGDVEWTNWGDRDLWRAAQLFVEPSQATAGAELSYGPGGRVPGPALAAILAVPLLVTSDPRGIQAWVLLLAWAGVAVAVAALGRRAGPVAAALGWLFLGAWPLVWDVTMMLWNPALVVGPLGLALAATDRVAGDRDGRWLVVFALAIGVGTQLHLSVGLLGLALLPGLVLARPRHALGGVGGALLVVLLLQAPYLLDEALHDWPNTRALMAQDVVERSPAEGGRSEALRQAAGLVVGEAPLGWEGSLAGTVIAAAPAALSALLAALAGAGVLLRLREPSALDRVVRTLLLGLVGVMGWYGADAFLQMSSRYLLVVVMPLGWLAACQAAHEVAGLRSRAAAGALTVGLLAVAATLLPRAWPYTGQRPGLSHARPLFSMFHALGERTGASLAELAGRVLVVRPGPTPSGWRWTAFPTLAFPLHAEGAAWSGSASGPCHLVFAGNGSTTEVPGLDAALVQAVLDQDVGGVTLEGVQPLDGVVVATYRTGHDRCVVSTGQRYVWTPREAGIAAAADALPCAPSAGPGRAEDGIDVVVALPLPSPGEACPRLAVGLALDAAHVTLESRQLRGLAYNRGAFADAALLRPTLLVAREGEVHAVVLAEGLVGRRGVSTPLQVPLGAAAGGRPVAFEAKVVFEDEGRASEAVRIELTR
ncbi:MAG: hypothetical protein H6732_07730 [Alphaproteobacteria bacterium]|nr:hypothetical protein [Alphaproteobacteria bacterium]